MKPRYVMIAVIVALLVLHGVVAKLSPLSYDDWDYLAWAAQHRTDPSWWSSFLGKFYTLGQALNYALARMPLLHVIITPVVGLALVWGTFALAMRRLPRAGAWADVIGIVVITAIIWIAAPRFGLVMFHRPNAAVWLYGTALAIWVLVPLRCGWQVRGGWLALLAIGGLLAATTARPLGLILVGGVAYAVRKERKRWMYVVLAAVVVGTAIGFWRQFFDFRGLRPGFELSLVALNGQIYEDGEIISLVGGLVLLKLVVGKLWPRYGGDTLPDTSETLRWFGVWFAYIALALFGPRYTEAAALPGALVVVIATFPIVQWVMTARPLRIAILALSILILIIAWAKSLAIYVDLAQQYRTRVTTLRATPRGTIATIKPYSQIRAGFFAYGEDWNEAARRQYVASTYFRLADIAFDPPFRRLELNPKLEMRLVAEGVTPEQLRAAGAPETWSGTIKSARQLFETVRANLKPPPPTMRLVVDGLSSEILRGRELLAATVTLVPKVTRRTPDDESRQGILVSPSSFGTQYPEAYALVNGQATPLKFARSRYLVPAMTTQIHNIIACNPERCILVDAFIPSL